MDHGHGFPDSALICSSTLQKEVLYLLCFTLLYYSSAQSAMGGRDRSHPFDPFHFTCSTVGRLKIRPVTAHRSTLILYLTKPPLPKYFYLSSKYGVSPAVKYFKCCPLCLNLGLFCYVLTYIYIFLYFPCFDITSYPPFILAYISEPPHKFPLSYI
jgi:hypothetical protein